ncbi:MAG: CHAT domain-containing protein [Spirulina sp. SIO3F2]|nr:CHAT domain-containing protein [Spirulina sp. SIO3F2]
MQIQNFQLSVTPLGGDRYLVRTEQVEPGVPLAEAQVTWPVADWLAHTQQAMDDPLVSLFQTQSTRGTGTLDNLTLDLRQLGQELYTALFAERLRDSWVSAQSIAHNQRAVLRLRLGLRGDRLTRLPWEVLHAPPASQNEQFHPLTTGTEILFSRYQMAATRSLPAVTLTSPLKILMVVTQPDDLGSLDLPQEIRHLKTELERGPTPAQLRLLEQPSRQELAQVLEQGQYHVFHYAGHSDLGDAGGTIHLVNPVTGGTESLAGNDLAGLLVNNGVQLAVFNSCRSSDTTFGSVDEQSLSQALVQRGVPAVLAMAEQVPDEVSLAFTRLLYRNVLQGHPLDLALSRARQGLLSSYGSSQLYWALPVLYLHPQSQGVLVPETVPTAVESEAAIAALPQWLQDELAQDAQDQQIPPENGAADAEAAAFVGDVLADFATPPQATSSNTTATATSKPTVPPDPEQTTPPPVTLQRPSHPSGAKWRSRLLIGGSIAAILVAVSALSWQFWQSRPSGIASAPQNSLSNGEATAEETELLAVQAIAALSNSEYSQGLAAVAVLLDRNAIPYAESALGNIPPEHQDDPEVLYLYGRLAWQGWLAEGDYSSDDARRYWEEAVRRNDSVVAYHIALGFAYYEEGRLNAANQAWRDALKLIEADDDADLQIQSMIYAGLALSLKQLADEPSPNRNTLLIEAQQLRDRVFAQTPTEFTIDALAQNWLWTEAAIEDWTLGW